MIYLGLAGAYQQMDDYDHAAEAYQRPHPAMAGRRAILSPNCWAVSALALLAIQHGQLHFAFEIASQGIERVEHSGSLPPISRPCMANSA